MFGEEGVQLLRELHRAHPAGMPPYNVSTLMGRRDSIFRYHVLPSLVPVSFLALVCSSVRTLPLFNGEEVEG